MAEPAILYVERDVLSALAALDLDYHGLIDCLRSADGERALCTSNDAKGFDLILMNARVGRALRDRFVGKVWVKDETDNQPGILNPLRKVRVIPCNFDEGAGVITQNPTNLREKGSASGSKTRCNATPWLWGLDAPEARSPEDCVTYVLGSHTDTNGTLRAELSLPLDFKSNKYRLFNPRIILLDGSDRSLADRKRSDRDGPTDIIDIQIKRK